MPSAKPWTTSTPGAVPGPAIRRSRAPSPQTLGYGLEDSPAGLAAWIVEKFRSWSDCGGDVERSFTKDQLLTNVMVYWVTATATSSTRLYYEMRQAGRLGPAQQLHRRTHRHRQLPGRDHQGAPPVGGAPLPRDPLGRDGTRRPFRRDGSARSVRRRPPPVLPHGAVTATVQFRRRSFAQRVSSWRVDSCSLRRTADTWDSTVLTEMARSRAISR